MLLRILLVDDHKIIRSGLRAILEPRKEFVVIGEAENGTEALAVCEQKHPDVVVMDIGLPDVDGIEATRLILRNAPETKVIMLSIYNDEASVVGAIQAGAQGYVLKSASGRDLLEAVRTVSNGGTYLSPQVSSHLLHRIKRGGPQSTPATLALAGLTPRESQVFRLVAAGNSSKDIAGILSVGVGTVLTYRKTLMRKLGVNNIADLTKLAIATDSTHVSNRPAAERAALSSIAPNSSSNSRPLSLPKGER